MATNRVSPSPSLEGSLNGDTLPLRERSSDPRGQRSPHQRRGSDDQVIGAGEDLLEPVYNEQTDIRDYTPELLPLETDQGSVEVAEYENPELGAAIKKEQQDPGLIGGSRESRNEDENPVPVIVGSSQEDLDGPVPATVGPDHTNADPFQTRGAPGQTFENQAHPNEVPESPRYDTPTPVNTEEESRLNHEGKAGLQESQPKKGFGGGMAVATGHGRFSPLSRSNRVSPEGQEWADAGTSYGYEKGTEHSAMYNRDRQSLLERKQTPPLGAESTDDTGCCAWVLYIFSILLIIVTLPFSLMFTIKVVQEYERAVIFRLGRLPSGGAKGPGIFFIIPCIESYTKIDLRTVSFDVPPQEVLTKDSVTVSVDAVVYYRVSNPTVSVANVENAHHSTRLLAQTTLRNILGTKNMSEILSDRESISQGIQTTLDDATDRWGIKVERVEIKDVRLPVQLQRAMAAEAEAAREARAKVIAAEGEQKASRALKEAADVMNDSSAALQLRYLQTLNSISAEKNSTILFPVPIDFMSSFKKK